MEKKNNHKIALAWYKAISNDDKFTFGIQMFGKVKLTQDEIQRLYFEYMREKEVKEITESLKTVNVMDWWLGLSKSSQIILSQICLGVNNKKPNRRVELYKMYDILIIKGILS